MACCGKPNQLCAALPRNIEIYSVSLCNHGHAVLSQNPSLLSLHETYLTSRPSLVMCLERENAVRHLLDILGPWDPRDARRQGQLLWRAAFGVDPVCNGLHGKNSHFVSVRVQKDRRLNHKWANMF